MEPKEMAKATIAAIREDVERRYNQSGMLLRFVMTSVSESGKEYSFEYSERDLVAAWYLAWKQDRVVTKVEPVIVYA